MDFFVCFQRLSLSPSRLCVSASQDGKLIVWDSITTNKVGRRKFLDHNYTFMAQMHNLRNNNFRNILLKSNFFDGTKRSVRLNFKIVVLFNNIWGKERGHAHCKHFNYGHPIMKYIIYIFKTRSMKKIINGVYVSKAGTFVFVYCQLLASCSSWSWFKETSRNNECSVYFHQWKCFSPASCVSSGQRHPSQVLLGDDLRLCPLRELGGLRRPGQHVLHLQPQGQRWECQGHAWAGSTHRWVKAR